MISMQTTGVPEEPVQSTFSTLQDSTHHISTAYGISEQTYSGVQRKQEGKLPIQGGGQGSGHAGATWVNESAIILRILAMQGMALQWLSSFTSLLISLAALIFIDDCDLFVSAPHQDSTGKDLIPQMQHSADLWEGCLHATGGAINSEKSAWYFLDYEYDNSQQTWKYLPTAKLPGQLLMKDLDGTRKPLQRMEPSEAVKSLGMFPTPEGNSDQQEEYFIDRVQE